MTSPPPRSRTTWIYIGVAAAVMLVWVVFLIQDPRKVSSWLGLTSMALLLVSNVIGLRRGRRKDADRAQEP